MAAQGRLNMSQIAALPQSHLLYEACQLVQVRRIVGYSSDAGFRQIIKFHILARCDFREGGFSATVRFNYPINTCEQRKSIRDDAFYITNA